MTDLTSVAAGLGLWVFPCDGNKHPCVKGGFKAAASDRAQIVSMFRSTGAKLIGVPTGRVNSIVVIDVDVKGDAKGMDWLNLNADALPPTLTHKTRSGGLHLVFKCPPDIEIRNSASRVAPGIDVRGEGGYVVWPPSEGYQIADPIEPAEMPQWLIHDCLPQERAPQPVIQRHDQITDGGSKYGLAALSKACNNIRNAPEGTKHDTLNREAYSIGGLVTAGELQQSAAYTALNSALADIRSRCEDFRSAQKTIETAFDDGMAAPRAVQRMDNYRPQPNTPAQQPDKPDKTPDKPPTPPRILDYFTFQDAEADLDAADFVEGLLIERAMSVVYGESNTGKTFWMTDLALHVAAGQPWCGREVEQGSVLYLALEGSHGIRNRIAAFKQAYGIEDGNLPFAVVTTSLNLLDPEADASAVVATCQAVAARFETPVKLIVVDTLARAMAGGNENAPEDMGSLVKTGDLLRDGTKAHLTYIHHSGKDTAKGARGHSSLRAATDTEIEITADGKSRQAEVRKQRDLEGGDVWRFELAPVVLGTNRRGKEVTSCVVKVVETLETFGDVSTHNRLKSLTGHKKRAFDVLCDAMRRGQPGFGAPPGILSIPETWWRTAFYENAMAGAEQKAKEKAFRRAADDLVEGHFVGLRSGRVWLVYSSPETNSSESYDSGDI